jgi:hypothetical protein
VQDANKPVPERSQRLMMGGTAGPVGVIAAPRARRGGQGGERPQVAGIHQPLITRRSGNNHRAEPGGSGEWGGAGEGLAALGGGMPVWVVAELASIRAPSTTPSPGRLGRSPRLDGP